MKRFSAFLAGAALSAAVIAVPLCGCVAQNGLSVESISCSRTDDGYTEVTIIYSDPSVAPTMFRIPDGSDGKDGAGIADITSKPDENGGATQITIEYTDGREDSVFSLPFGTFISGVSSSVDADSGDTTLTINFSDDSLDPYVITLPAGEDGKDGEDGSRITRITSSTDPETGETTVCIEYDDGEKSSFTVAGGKAGEDGAGIENISVDSALTAIDPDNVYLEISFTDGTSQSLTIPKVNRWHTGSGEPSPSLGNVGDYYTDSSAAKIYVKSAEGGWSLLFDFSDYSKARHSVRFVADGVTYCTQTLSHGVNFYSAGISLPLPEKEGYEFVGWYTSPTPTVNDGKFDNLTYVLSDMTLYANFVPVG